MTIKPPLAGPTGGNMIDVPETIDGTPTVLTAGRRLAVTAENGLNISGLTGTSPEEEFKPDGWWVSYSPRNDNAHAEGYWSEWVELAKAILAEDQRRKSLPDRPEEE